MQKNMIFFCVKKKKFYIFLLKINIFFRKLQKKIDFFSAEKILFFFFSAENLIYSCGKNILFFVRQKYFIFSCGKNTWLFRAEKIICLIIHFAQKTNTFFHAEKIYYSIYFSCGKNILFNLFFVREKILYIFLRKKYTIFRAEK